jgi:hypothetical protein
METTKKSATDVIITAMEQADDMEDVIVVYRMKSCRSDEAGVAWHSNTETLEALGMLEMAKAGLLFNKGHD